MSEEVMGSSIGDFLKEVGTLEGAQPQAVKEVVARQLVGAMRTRKISKSKRAALVKTSRSQVDRPLDPRNNIAFGSLQRAAAVVGRRLEPNRSRKSRTKPRWRASRLELVPLGHVVCGQWLPGRLDLVITADSV